MPLKRINKYCAYYPCHFNLEDCTFCYCPFYPCLNKKRGKFIYSKKLDRDIWSCEECTWIHKKSVVDSIYNFIRNHKVISNREGKEGNYNTGVIILGHGSRIKEANKLISDMAKIVAAQGWPISQPAYFQFRNPTLSKSIDRLIKKGCKRIVVVPFFLSMGNHVARDIPKLIKQEAKQHKRTEFIYAKNLGLDSRIGEIVLERIEEALGSCKKF